MAVVVGVDVDVDDVGVRESFEGLRLPDIDTEQADRPRLRMVAETPRISAGRSAWDVKERWDMILLGATTPSHT